jgi:GLPGLI family protein
MKKSFILLTLFTFMLSCSAFRAWSGKPFEGVITYKISYPDSKYTESQLAMFPKIFTITVKSQKSLSEMASGMGTQRVIIDYATQTKVSLLDMMGQKYAVKQTREEIEKENAQSAKPTVTLTSDTKLICGYLCKKAIVTSEEKGTKSTYEIYFTNELGSGNMNFDNPLYKDIDGVLMEFTIKTQQFSMKFLVTNVEKKSVPSSLFEIPADYKLTTQEELKSKFGGME